MAWVSTALFSVPQHGILAGGFDPSAWRLLVATNWIRTLAWTARAGIMLMVTHRLLR